MSAVTDQPLDLVRPLMQSLERDVLPRDASRGGRDVRHPHRCSFDRAVERALAEWERTEALAAR